MRREIDETKQKIRNAVIRSITPIMVGTLMSAEADVGVGRVQGARFVQPLIPCSPSCRIVLVECLPQFLVTARKDYTEIMQYIESKVWGVLITTLQNNKETNYGPKTGQGK